MSYLIEYWSNWVKKSELWYIIFFQRKEKSLRDLYLQCWLNISSISLLLKQYEGVVGYLETLFKNNLYFNNKNSNKS